MRKSKDVPITGDMDGSRGDTSRALTYPWLRAHRRNEQHSQPPATPFPVPP